jgi:hypothetical protein
MEGAFSVPTPKAGVIRWASAIFPVHFRFVPLEFKGVPAVELEQVLGVQLKPLAARPWESVPPRWFVGFCFLFVNIGLFA